ncbi:ras-like GTP-binding protein RHO [Diorhabda carinulata]|uniref:ras-like GTP-binding protein RHO n=1 Tax=Diorhabda carinulata TaxID=1163345 RepID=UPI0025A182AE|nr:ras-like GTP-binding protein RHO [Diorhabda carinulata]
METSTSRKSVSLSLDHLLDYIHLERKKLVILGDEGCGKTSLLRAFTRKQSSEYVPKILEYSIVNVKLPDKEIELAMWNTAGQERYDCLCNIIYTGADVALICFSFDKPKSLDNVVTKWYPELKRACRNIPVILVGNKIDLRVNKKMYKLKRIIGKSDGRATARKIKALCYIECSSKNNVAVNDVFENVIRAISTPEKNKTRSSKLFFIKSKVYG